MSKLASKGYKEHIDQLCSATCLREGDLDDKAISLFDALQQKGKAREACAFLEQALQGKERNRVTNWRGYLYTILRSFDGSTYKEVKRGGVKSEAGTKGGHRRESNKKNSLPISDFSFRTAAPEFVPGAGAWGKGEEACKELCDSTKKDSFTKVLVSDDGRGNATVASKTILQGQEILREPPLALVYSADDHPWLKEMRSELEKEDSTCAWQYCVAVHCLSDDELPSQAKALLKPISKDVKIRLEELCGAADSMKDLEPSTLALIAARHVLKKFGSDKDVTQDEGVLAAKLDDLAARVSRNGFQIMDLTRRPPTSADGLFHRISFCNHCCLGMNNASWTWDGKEGVQIVKASRDIAEGEEITISYIAKPWCDLAKPARQRYLQQNFNFLCLCKACALSAEEEEHVRTRLDSHTAVGDEKSGKLGSLLKRWLENGKETVGDDAVDIVETPREQEACAKEKRSGPLTDQDRLLRVLARCEKDGLSVSKEQAQAALVAEDGHVGKTVIRIKRQQNDNTPMTHDSSVETGSSSAIQSIPYASIAVAIVACVSVMAVMRIRMRAGR